MQFPIDGQDRRFKVIMIVAVALSVITTAQHHLVLSFPVNDPFHYGEFFAAAMAVLHQAPFKGDPFTIHGAADILPALAVNLFLSVPEHLIAYTLVIYPILSLVAVLLIIFSALQIVRRLGGDQLLLIPFLMLVPFAIGWRDLFFVLSLSLFAELVSSREGRHGRVTIQILFGLVIALGTYWSFNRGAAALLAFGPVTLWLALQDRRFLISVGAALVSFPIIGVLLPGISVFGYLENFLMLLEASSQWSYPPSRFGRVWTAALLATLVISTGAALIVVRRRGLDRHRIALIAALAIAGAVYVKIGLGRIDYTHLVMAAWVPLLITSVSLRWNLVDMSIGWTKRVPFLVLIFFAAMMLFHLIGSKHAILLLLATFAIVLGPLLSPRGRFGVSMIMAVLVIARAASAPVEGIYKVVRGDFDWLISLNVLPMNDIAVTEEVLWTAQRIDQSGAECIFDLVNTGLVNAVAGLPSCSRFTYPVYANTNFEGRLVSDLSAANPPVIVYNSDYWSYAIDGRPMNERFPVLDALIQRIYPREECNLGVCLRYQK